MYPADIKTEVKFFFHSLILQLLLDSLSIVATEICVVAKMSKSGSYVANYHTFSSKLHDHMMATHVSKQRFIAKESGLIYQSSVSS